ncbi:hypothetical protein FK529_08795 [Tsukamurella asaccharolytica]|uniref:Uncharacterized protein n=1 Tax=Tsukamurella asaccharolytica TaxID=2592067 RepID=A0A5C5RCR6_9ACTN|nr:hypothetical protein FK529_08795 [Tsukamurella asaccharolytica]
MPTHWPSTTSAPSSEYAETTTRYLPTGSGRVQWTLEGRGGARARAARHLGVDEVLFGREP